MLVIIKLMPLVCRLKKEREPSKHLRQKRNFFVENNFQRFNLTVSTQLLKPRLELTGKIAGKEKMPGMKKSYQALELLCKRLTPYQ